MASSTVAAMPIEPAAPLLAAPRRHSTVGWQIASGIRRNPAAIISLVVLGMVTIAAIFATSLTVAVAATLLTLVIGVVVGSIAGYAGGRTDALIMRFVDAMYAFPDLLFVILVSALVRGQLSGEVTGWLVVASVIDRASSGLFPVFLSLGLTSWLTTARLVRAQLLSLKHREYVQASRGAGARSGFILRKHLLPNTLAPLIVAATLAVPNAILLEAGLSFIGLGVQPPTPSWGIMISDGVASLRSFPHLMLIPALTIGLTLLAFNVLGDALRDAVDPLLQHSR